jgi:hypothetical protein
MTYTAPASVAEYFNRIMSEPFVHALLVGIALAAALLVLFALLRKAGDFVSASPRPNHLSREARKGLERSGYKVVKTRTNGYQVSKPRTVASYR